MKNLNRDLIFRIVASVLTFICIFLLFAPWIKLADGDLRKDAKKGLKEFNAQIKDVDRDDLKDLEEYFEEEDINISPKKILDNAKKVVGVLLDTEVAPSESFKLFSGVNGLFKVITNEDVIDSNAFRMWGSDDFFEELSEKKAIVNLMIILPILFLATLISGIAVTVLHALNKKFTGISLVICSGLSFVTYLIMVIRINSWSNDEFYEKLVKISAAPIWLLILSVAAMLLWMKKDQIGDALFGKKSGATDTVIPRPQMMPVSSATESVFCANCGTKLEPDSSFCPECGTPRS